MSETQALVFTVAIFALVFLMTATLGRWHVLQTAVFLAVVCSNIAYEWTPNPYLAAVIGAAAAYGATWLLSGWGDKRRAITGQ